jgi:hypothetical protein
MTAPSSRIVAAALLVSLAGCAESAIHPVRGRVVFPDGKPLEHGTVILDTGMSKEGSWGAVRSDGTFVMGSNTPDDGVPAGTWRVFLANAHRPASDSAPQSPPLVHAKFLNPETSGLSFTVPDQPVWEIVVEKPSK